ncbi:pectin lyase [Plectosphaerella plurivora]|uniref:pectin lyase n=1 Tax=Plectosphaerella plurivora TaxID=936078 RepID=A0A9P9A8T3_9PEZI|nr:pectin lyase [Plectosphaerella plurivora]
MHLQTLVSFLGLAAGAFAQVKRSPFGFAAGTTGGGNAAPVYPTTTAQLVSYLTDNQARVIMLDRTFDFLQSEGQTSGKCCKLPACSNGNKPQDYLGEISGCSSGTWSTCTYWKAPTTPIDVKSNKSIVGVGSKGIIRGKGLRLRASTSNVIIQNIHFTDLNPQYVWGGDQITLDGADRVWIDHNKFSLAGRQFIVSGWGAAGRVTISDNEFDGRTTWSVSCNNKHYWALLLIGANDFYTIAGNYFHDLSGRAPHLGTGDSSSNVVHAVNNYFQSIDGHAFDIQGNAWALLEGNYYENVKEPVTSGSGSGGAKIYDIRQVADASNAQSTLGYIPEWNRNAGTSGVPKVRLDKEAIQKLGQYKSAITWSHWKVENVPTNVRNNAGVGKV